MEPHPNNHSSDLYRHCVIDANNLFWRCYHAIDLTSLGEYNGGLISTDIVKVFFQFTDKFQTKFFGSDTEFYFLFDNPESKIKSRKDIDSSYKHDREKKNHPDLVYNTLDFIKDLLYFYGDNIHICRYDGMEADDLTYYLRPRIGNQKTLYCSADLDWARNISDFADWHDWKGIYTMDNFQLSYGFPPGEDHVKMYKTIRGDKSDNIPPGCPFLPASLVLKAVYLKTLPAMYESLASFPPQWQDKLLAVRDRLEMNYRLVDFKKDAGLTFEDISVRGRADAGQMQRLKEQAGGLEEYSIF